MTTGLSESKIKQVLKRHLRESGEVRNAKVLTELCVDDFSRRADVVLVNGKLSAFEIKGDQDSLYRLDGQVATFSKFFESLTVVCSAKHTGGVLDKVPPDVGVWQVTTDECIEIVRSPVTRLNQDIDVWLSFLPVRVLTPIATKRGIRVGLGGRGDLLKLLRQQPVDEIRREVLAFLKSPRRVPKEKKPLARSVKNDPLATHLQRVHDFLAMTTQSNFATTAIPRKPSLTSGQSSSSSSVPSPLSL